MVVGWASSSTGLEATSPAPDTEVKMIIDGRNFQFQPDWNAFSILTAEQEMVQSIEQKRLTLENYKLWKGKWLSRVIDGMTYQLL